MNELTGLVRRCIDDYDMINQDETVAVGVSGGKDSLALLAAMAGLSRYHPKNFKVEAVTLDLGFDGMDFEPVARFCDGLDVPFTLVKTDIREIVFDIRKEPNPCSLCAKMRRGALLNAVKERGIVKLALGHHFDDAVETFFLSLVYEGRLNCFKPVTWMSRSETWQIRPMLYAGETRIERLVEEYGLPVVKSTCPSDRDSKRREIKDLIRTLSVQYPDLKDKVFGAMKRLPLEGW